jgi:hypothetical protein
VYFVDSIWVFMVHTSTIIEGVSVFVRFCCSKEYIKARVLGHQPTWLVVHSQ